MALVCIVMTLHRFSWDGLYGTRGVGLRLYLRLRHVRALFLFFLVLFYLSWLWLVFYFRSPPSFVTPPPPNKHTQVHVSYSLFCRRPFSSLFFFFVYSSLAFFCLLLFHYSLLTILLLLHLGSLCQQALSSFTFPILLSSFPALERLFVFFFSPYVTLVLDACFSSYALLLLSA